MRDGRQDAVAARLVVVTAGRLKDSFSIHTLIASERALWSCSGGCSRGRSRSRCRSRRRTLRWIPSRRAVVFANEHTVETLRASRHGHRVRPLDVVAEGVPVGTAIGNRESS